MIGAISDHQEGNTIYAATNITGGASQTGGSKDAVVVAHSHTATSNDVTPPLGITEIGRLDLAGSPGTGGNFHRGGGWEHALL